VIATGLAEEKRTSSQINRTSALENCETSAIGRALAAFGLGGSEYASANEVQNAIHQQSRPKIPTPSRMPKMSTEELAFFERMRKGIEEAHSQADLDAIKDLGRTKQLSAKTKEQLNKLWISRKQFLEGEHDGTSNTRPKQEGATSKIPADNDPLGPEKPA
jgi:hypothetical protein